MNGIILIDKPQDWTSHDVVGKLRRLLRENVSDTPVLWILWQRGCWLYLWAELPVR